MENKFFAASVLMIDQQVVHTTITAFTGRPVTYMTVFFEEVDINTNKKTGIMTRPITVDESTSRILYYTLLKLIQEENFSIINHNVLSIGSDPNNQYVFSGKICKQCHTLISLGNDDTCNLCKGVETPIRERIYQKNSMKNVKCAAIVEIVEREPTENDDEFEYLE